MWNLQGKRNFEGVIKDLEMRDYSGYKGRLSIVTRVLTHEKRRQKSQSEKDMCPWKQRPQ